MLNSMLELETNTEKSAKSTPAHNLKRQIDDYNKHTDCHRDDI